MNETTLRIMLVYVLALALLLQFCRVAHRQPPPPQEVIRQPLPPL